MHGGEDQLMEELASGITKVELGRAQRYDHTLSKIREKAGRKGEPYFWKNGLLMRKPYQLGGKDVIIIPNVTRQNVFKVDHTSPP